MYKRSLAILALTAALVLAVSALAAPLLTDGTHTAYLGDSNYLYLTDDEGNTKVLRSPVVDLLGMDAEQLYCVSGTGRLYGIRLDGSSTSVIASSPTQEELDAVTAAPVFGLADGVLTFLDGGNIPTIIDTNVQAAFAVPDVLYYVVKQDDGCYLHGYPLVHEGPESGAPVYTVQITVPDTLSLMVSGNIAALVAEDRSVRLIDVTANDVAYVPACSEDTAAAVFVNGSLFRYTLDENGRYLIESYEAMDTIHGKAEAPATQAPIYVTNPPAAAPTAKPTATVRPTATPRPTAKPTAAPTDDGSIRYGDKGKAVRRMQQRLYDLGYLTDKVDGTFGPKTLRALHLFQTAVGYTERSYASASLLKKLNAASAPMFDPYRPCKPGDRNTYVLIMQEMLNDIGYKLQKLDGVYGEKTRAAVLAFQQASGYPAEKCTGIADADTMFDLQQTWYWYGTPTEAPVSTGTPVPTATPQPTAAPVPGTPTDLN